MKNLLFAMTSIAAITAMAQTETADSTQTQTLKEVVVESQNHRLGAEVSTYIPTSKQKNSAQTAPELLARMAIPQLRISANDEILDFSGKSVDAFIDFLPASKEDLEGIRLADVKKVEYYDYPTDPRFLGKAHAVNFVMQKYEYGGYVKTYGWENTANAGQASVYGKLQYKRMIFDIAAGAFYINQGHMGADTYETFHLPQADGTVSTFERISLQDDDSLRKRTYWPTFKALYASENITLQNIVGASFDHTPYSHSSGTVAYCPVIVVSANYRQLASNRVNSFSYTGNWSFTLNKLNSITFNPRYAYSHTTSSSLYEESTEDAYFNAAKDDSHQFQADLTYSHSFGKRGTLNALIKASMSSAKTWYAGTTEMADDALNYRIGPGVQYSLSFGKIYGLAGLGLQWDRQEYLDYSNTSVVPWADFSLQYAPNQSHSLRCEFGYVKSVPSASCRSAALILSNPLMSYTGNPNLESFGRYYTGVIYSLVSGNNFSFSAYGNAWVTDNRYVYDYKPTASGIVRTIEQPGGGYAQWHYGLYGTLRLFDGKLQLNSQAEATSVHNGYPYDYDRTHVDFALQANFYLDNWSFGALYYAPQGYSDGYLVGTWVKAKAFYRINIGWSNQTWNFQFRASNFACWNWRSDRTIMNSPYYDKTEQTYSIDNQALAHLSVTYTFGFGKKVQHGDEATQQSGISSGILK